MHVVSLRSTLNEKKNNPQKGAGSSPGVQQKPVKTSETHRRSVALGQLGVRGWGEVPGVVASVCH